MNKLLLLALVALVQGCASAPPDRTGQHLVTEWYYVSLTPGEVARHSWDNFTKMCKYNDGVTVNVGRGDCPVRMKTNPSS